MNLLNSVFDIDEIEIVNINKKYYVFLIIMIVLLIIIGFINKNRYYYGNIVSSNNDVLLLVDKDNINNIKNTNKIIIDNLESKYSINKITPTEDAFLVSVNINTDISINSGNRYKVYLGKESLFNYIVRIIKG